MALKMEAKFPKAVCALAALVYFVGCDQGIEIEKTSTPGERVWVVKFISGGRQCDPHDRYTPPDTKRLLQKHGIIVYGTWVEHMPVCAACGCPSYAAKHYAVIRERDVQKARELGFEQTEPPVMAIP
jgi:hypothetical protein